MENQLRKTPNTLTHCETKRFEIVLNVAAASGEFVSAPSGEGDVAWQGL